MPGAPSRSALAVRRIGAGSPWPVFGRFKRFAYRASVTTLARDAAIEERHASRRRRLDSRTACRCGPDARNRRRARRSRETYRRSSPSQRNDDPSSYACAEKYSVKYESNSPNAAGSRMTVHGPGATPVGRRAARALSARRAARRRAVERREIVAEPFGVAARVGAVRLHVQSARWSRRTRATRRGVRDRDAGARRYARTRGPETVPVPMRPRSRPRCARDRPASRLRSPRTKAPGGAMALAAAASPGSPVSRGAKARHRIRTGDRVAQ